MVKTHNNMDAEKKVENGKAEKLKENPQPTQYLDEQTQEVLPVHDSPWCLPERKKKKERIKKDFHRMPWPTH